MAHLVENHDPLVLRLTENMERPALDDRTYRVIRLPNTLEALLISDPDKDKSQRCYGRQCGQLQRR